MTDCRECGAPLARDQKYCVACGTRRGDLPGRIARAIAALDLAPPPVVAGVPPILAPPPAAPVFGGLSAAVDFWLEGHSGPSPRVCAIAVMSLLAFGVVLGSIVGPTAARSSVYVLPSPAPPAAAAPADAAPPAVMPSTPAAAEPVEVDAGETPPKSPPAAAAEPKINHVWLIVLSGQGYSSGIGNAAANSYLTNELVGRGEVIENYYAVAQSELANSIALVSGQGPTWQILKNCPIYQDIAPATVEASAGQVTGDGCVFPETVRTLPEAIAATGRSSRAYVEDVDNVAGGTASSCRHPAPGAADPDHEADAGDPYVSWSNPLIYFRSITKVETDCALTVTGLNSLEIDLNSGAAPAFSLIVPNRCHSGSDVPCAPGAPSGLASSDDFLASAVTKITASKDYADGGLIAITFDHSPQGAPGADVSSCCGQPVFPNLAAAPAPVEAAPTQETGATGATSVIGATGATGASGEIASPSTPPYVAQTPLGEAAGGGKVGLLLISPFVKAGSVNVTDSYNHFSLLLSIEQIFGTEKLGYTVLPAVSGFSTGIFNASGG